MVAAILMVTMLVFSCVCFRLVLGSGPRRSRSGTADATRDVFPDAPASRVPAPRPPIDEAGVAEHAALP